MLILFFFPEFLCHFRGIFLFVFCFVRVLGLFGFGLFGVFLSFYDFTHLLKYHWDKAGLFTLSVSERAMRSPQLNSHISLARNLCSFLDKEGISDVCLAREREISTA